MSMKRSIIRTAHAPAAIGPYSQAVVVPVGGQRMVFCSGQIALDPATGALIEGDIAAQTRQVLENVRAALARAGATMEHVVRTRIYVRDIRGWEAIGRVHGEYFGAIRPATAMVEVSGLVDPDMLVEIEVDACVTD